MNENIAAGHSARHPSESLIGLRHARASTRGRPKPSCDDIAETEDGHDNRLCIRIADNPLRRNHASSLIQRRYAWRGYASSPLDAGSAARVTLSACAKETTVATVTVGVDSDDEGLYVGRLYADVVDQLRDEGRKLCEFTKLAVDESVRSHSVLGAIFHVASMFIINLHHCTDALIEVNPRHASFYQRMLGFKPAAGERIDPAVNAPAVLLRLDLAHCAREIARLGGRRNAGHVERSFYPYFFAPEEAVKIVRRLRDR